MRAGGTTTRRSNSTRTRISKRVFTQYNSTPSAAFDVEPSGQWVYSFRVVIHTSGTPFAWPVTSKRRSSGSEATNSPSRFRNESLVAELDASLQGLSMVVR